MDNQEKYEHWKDIAQYDFETAKAVLNSGRYLYVVFMCQQSIEKLVKGLHVLYKVDTPTRKRASWLRPVGFSGDETPVCFQ